MRWNPWATARVGISAVILAAVSTAAGCGSGSPSTKVEKDKAPEKIDGKPPRVRADQPASKQTELKQIDAAAIRLLSEGKQSDAFTKWLTVAKTYKDVSPEDCTPEESLEVAKIYMRITAVGFHDLGEEGLRLYKLGANAHAARGGIAKKDIETWEEKIFNETMKLRPKN